MESPAKLTRDNTMQVTAKEGIEFLEKTSPELAEKCKAVAKESAENGAGDAPEVTNNGTSPVKMTRDNTMVTTAQEGKEFLEKQGGVNEDAKTRGQETELNKSLHEEDKPATKRPADDGDNAEVEEKKQKTEEEDVEDGNETKQEANEEKKEEAAVEQEKV